MIENDEYDPDPSDPPGYRYVRCCLLCDHSDIHPISDLWCKKFHRYVADGKICDEGAWPSEWGNMPLK